MQQRILAVIRRLPPVYVQGLKSFVPVTRRAIHVVTRRTPIVKIHRVPRLTTADVKQAQRARHVEVQGTVKRILPRGLAREWSGIYRLLGDEGRFRIMAAYLQTIALNEADGQDWNPFYDAVMDDARLSDADKEVFVELVLDLQARALAPESASPEETDAAFQEMLAWGQ